MERPRFVHIEKLEGPDFNITAMDVSEIQELATQNRVKASTYSTNNSKLKNDYLTDPTG